LVGTLSATDVDTDDDALDLNAIHKTIGTKTAFLLVFKVSFADSQTNSLINRVLSANGLSNVIPTSSRKVERWDTWTNAKVVIGKSIANLDIGRCFIV
jgi:hypothetical protein